MDLVRVLGRAGFNEVGVVLVGGIAVDLLQGSLVEGDVIEFTLVQKLESDGNGFDHLNGDGIEALAVGIVPVVRALGEDLLVLVFEVGHGVSAVVPHIFPGHVAVAIDTHFFDHFSGERVQAVVGGNGREVRQFVDQSVGDGAGFVINSDANHFGEFGIFVGGQRVSGFGAFGFGQFHGVVVVIFSTGDHFHRHGSVVGVVLRIVQNPFQTGSPVGSDDVSLDFAVFVEPGHAFVQGEDPGLAAIGAFVGLRGIELQVTVVVIRQQTIDQVAENVQVGSSLGIVDIPGFQLTSFGFIGVEVGQFFSVDKSSGGEDHDQG